MAIDGLICAAPYPKLESHKFPLAVFVLCLAVACPLPLFAAPYGSGARSTVTPVDQERDRQEKRLLQEKIQRELEENRRRVLEQSKEKSKKSEAQKANSQLHD